MPLNAPRYRTQPPINAYGDGGFRIGGQRVEGSILLTPEGFYPWPTVVQPEDITPETLGPVVEAAPSFEILLLGTGPAILRPDPQTRAFLSDANIPFDVMDTGAAARTYNVLLAEERRVAAALIAVD